MLFLKLFSFNLNAWVQQAIIATREKLNPNHVYLMFVKYFTVDRALCQSLTSQSTPVKWVRLPVTM